MIYHWLWNRYKFILIPNLVFWKHEVLSIEFKAIQAPIFLTYSDPDF